jgi:hypothetical protein
MSWCRWRSRLYCEINVSGNGLNPAISLCHTPNKLSMKAISDGPSTGNSLGQSD